MNIEIFKKDVTKIKLIITPTRIHLKVPLNIQLDTERYVNFVTYVYNVCTKEHPIAFPLRGSIYEYENKLCIQLKTSNKNPYLLVMENN